MDKQFILPDGTDVNVVLYDRRKSFTQMEHFAGHFLDVPEVEIGFFLHDHVIFVFVNNFVSSLNGLTITNEICDNKRQFTLYQKDKPIYKKNYDRAKGYDNNPFYSTDEEDVDDLLWFTNVLTIQERTCVIKKTCSLAKGKA